MSAIILGKNLLPRDELIDHAFSPLNPNQLTVAELQRLAQDAAFLASLMLIRMMKVERIYVQTPKHPSAHPLNRLRNFSR